MDNFEKLGVFYLGREAPGPAIVSGPAPGSALLLYDSRDLLTHAVCVGMTGSGKTGLCVDLLEEAAIDGIPSVVIDPKGDLANLLLTFPGLKPEDFLPWVDEDEARKKGLSNAQFAEQQASLWRKGLGEWGQDGARIERLRDAADFVVYTPGSGAGVPVSILKSFDVPERAVLEDDETLMERIGTTATGLLTLLGVDADPLKSREHILICTILETAWRRGQGLDIARLIQSVRNPPFSRVGVFDLEAFFPEGERTAFAMRLNGLLAAPTMKAWTEGETIDPGRMLYGPNGKPRVAIFSIAHLGDAERMFFVTLLLLQVLGWMRSQSGTSSLRALLYMDEIFGYLPPVANPPSKAPLLTLLKQARAFGVGIVLATQNPVDLDYKALSNAGTWFIGRLQTERDRERLLDGLQGSVAGAGARFDRRKLATMLSGLGNRVFLMHNVHEDGPVLFESRWAMSYLRGPLTRDQIKRLMEPLKAAAAGAYAAGARAKEPAPAEVELPYSSADLPSMSFGRHASERPVLSPAISQFFLPVRKEPGDEGALVYKPMCLAVARVYYVDAKAGLNAERGISAAADVSPGPARPLWDEAVLVAVSERDLDAVPEPEALFGPVPAALGDPKNYAAWSRDFREWLYRSQSLGLYRSPSLDVVSAPGEPEHDFRLRLQQSGRERRDELLERIRLRYAARISSLQERIRRADQASEREREQAKQQQLQTAISLGVTLLDAFIGRKTFGRTTLGRATTAARGAGRIIREKQDVERAEENVQALRLQLAELQAEVARQTEALRASADPLMEELETLEIRPRKTDISLRIMGLGWVPYWRNEGGGMRPAF